MEMEKQKFDADNGNLSYVGYIRYILTIFIYKYIFSTNLFIYKCVSPKQINKAGVVLDDDKDDFDDFMTNLLDNRENKYWMLSNYLSSFIVFFVASYLLMYGILFIVRMLGYVNH